MQEKPTTLQSRDGSDYVRVVLAHKDWLAKALTSQQLSELLAQVRRNMEQERARLLDRHTEDPDGVLEVFADALEEGLEGIDLMLTGLKRGNQPKVMDGLAALARATSAVQDAG